MKNRYEVFQIDNVNDGCGNTSTQKTRLCLVTAESAQAAAQNVLAMFNPSLYCKYINGGFRQSEVVAELAK